MTPFDSLPSPQAGERLADAPEASLLHRFEQVRARSKTLAAPLSAEDMTAQSMPDASPAKWHLAHTTWFFETFLLLPSGAVPYDMAFQYLFNSYYESLGARQPRPARGLITRPSCAEVMAYREQVDAGVRALLRQGELDTTMQDLLVLGFAHEEQHQELLLMDVLHLFAQNRLAPAYSPAPAERQGATFGEPTRTHFDGGVVEIGHEGPQFAFDNEGPRHQVLLRPFALADRLVTNREWLAFMEDGGYAQAGLWLSDGWACRQAQEWSAPLYWREEASGWQAFGLHGVQPVVPDAPVAHVSYYEADAYARWCGARLPLEAEWETAVQQAGRRGAFLEDGQFTPQPSGGAALAQMFGDAWEWTASPYVAYPGFQAAAGAVGEYNGKFMINQMVLRGGCCVTPKDHIRATYRNFFLPHHRWQFSGIRLAYD